ncbi:MAG TPA: response regulator [Bacillota bacterium]|nr:response regulator [Bacillota bacterium]
MTVEPEKVKSNILVVDDDPKITSLLKRALTLEGYRVEVANDGLEGLKLAWTCVPDLVILDWMLPGAGRGGGVQAAAQGRGDSYSDAHCQGWTGQPG